MSGNQRPVLAALLSAGLVLAIGLPLIMARSLTEIPLATTADAQDFDRLWTQLQDLYSQSRALDPGESKRRTLDPTLSYLGLEPRSEAIFVEAVDRALANIGAGRARVAAVNARVRTLAEEPEVLARRSAWSRWQQDQQDAADLILAGLGSSGRSGLLAERRLAWLLSLDSCMRRGALPK